MSIATVGKTVTDFAQNLIRVTEEGCNLFTHPHTVEDELKWEQDVRNVWGNGTHDVGDEAASNAKEHVTRHLMDGGMSKEDAEKLFEPHWKKVAEIGEKARKAIPKMEETAKFGWLKFVGAIAALLTGGVVVATVTSGPSSEQRAMYRYVQREAAEQQQIQRIMVSEDAFNMMTGSLFVQSAPTPVKSPAPVAAAPAPMPVAIAARAAEPAEVSLTNPSGTKTVTSTVGQVYQSAPPQVRQEMERSAPAPAPPLKIDHGYDHENFNDCAHTHCLSSRHKEFTVDAGFASAHVKY